MASDIETKRDAFLALIQRKPAIMGILNVTPDSFSDGGRYRSTDAAFAQAQTMVLEGCDVIDIGGESTRPGAEKVSAKEELQRVIPVISHLSTQLDTPISIDTYKASVAREAALQGAAILNDVTGLQGDPEMAETAAEFGCAVIAMHNRADIVEDIDIIEDIQNFFDRTLSIAKRAGIPRDRLILDPGIGFGKTVEQNLTCIRELEKLKGFGSPLLLGLSRKSFIGKTLDTPIEDRLTGTLAANMVGVLGGARILRVHDVKEHRQMLDMLNALEALP